MVSTEPSFEGCGDMNWAVGASTDATDVPPGPYSDSGSSPLRSQGEPTTLPKAVIAAVTHGWSIIPVDKNKRPHLPTWKQYQQQAPDLDQVQAWHDRYHPAGWAVITGANSGIFILDFDGEQGQATLRRLGLDPHVRTGSGGSHVYLEYPGQHVPTLNSKTKKALNEHYPGLDVRGDGGYAVFWGRNTAGEYEWLRALIPERLVILPAQLRALLGLNGPAEPDPDNSTGRGPGAAQAHVPADILVERGSSGHTWKAEITPASGWRVNCGITAIPASKLSRS
jgi:hypothetical protein